MKIEPSTLPTTTIVLTNQEAANLYVLLGRVSNLRIVGELLEIYKYLEKTVLAQEVKQSNLLYGSLEKK